jgi:hypothetical protein
LAGEKQLEALQSMWAIGAWLVSQWLRNGDLMQAKSRDFEQSILFSSGI